MNKVTIEITDDEKDGINFSFVSDPPFPLDNEPKTRLQSLGLCVGEFVRLWLKSVKIMQASGNNTNKAPTPQVAMMNDGTNIGIGSYRTERETRLANVKGKSLFRDDAFAKILEHGLRMDIGRLDLKGSIAIAFCKTTNNRVIITSQKNDDQEPADEKLRELVVKLKKFLFDDASEQGVFLNIETNL